MVIPAYTNEGVLPPVSGGPTSPYNRSPYQSNMDEIIERFNTSDTRKELLIGLIEYRRALFNVGFIQGWQWIDGSFVENVEQSRGFPPKDVDIVTFFYRPIRYNADEAKWKSEVQGLFGQFFGNASKKYLCDSYPIDLNESQLTIVQNVTYWFGLFSHQRITNTWKGLIQIPLMNDPDEHTRLLQRIHTGV